MTTQPKQLPERNEGTHMSIFAGQRVSGDYVLALEQAYAKARALIVEGAVMRDGLYQRTFKEALRDLPEVPK